MDKDKLTKLSEMSMSRYLVGQSRLSKTTVKLKPKVKCAQYFLYSSDLKPGESVTKHTAGDEMLLISDFVSNRIVGMSVNRKKVLVNELASDLRPLGMAVVGNRATLAVIDGGLNGVALLKYYSRNDVGKLSLVECLTKTSDGNLKSCCKENNTIKYPENVCRGWEPKDIIETKRGDIIISDTSLCENRLSRYSIDGQLITSFGRAQGPGNSSFKKPLHMAIDSFGRIFASDWENRNVQVFDGRGMWLNVIGGCSNSNVRSKVKHSLDAFLGRPCGLSCDALGNVFVCDVAQSRLAMYSSSGSFIENIISHKKRSPSAVRINNKRRMMAVSYVDKKNSFKKFTVSRLPVTLE